MATGVPKRVAGPSVAAVRIEYPGKRAEIDILATPPGRYELVRRSSTGADNRLYFDDNLPALAALAADSAVRGKVRLVYIDPPYATQTVFHSRDLSLAYSDAAAGVGYLESLRARFVFLRDLLAPDGSIYLHLDEKMVFHAKLLLDEVFGPDNYRNCITRKKCNPKNYTRRTYGNVADYILFYTKSAAFVWNRPTEPMIGDRAREYQYTDPGSDRRYMKVPVHAPGVRNGETGRPWRGKMPPPGKHWQYPPRVLDEMDARGEIYWSPTGNPRRKVYLDENTGVGVQDIWMDFKDAHNQNVAITGYPTEKNPDILRRIVAASSNPGDVVLDCYAGSGTTLAVAAESGRRWIGIDNSPAAIAASLRRFTTGLQLPGDYVERNDRKTGVSLFDEVAEVSTAAPATGPQVTEFSLHIPDGTTIPAAWTEALASLDR